ncbi:acyl-CoA dehydrogenase [Dietzia psychralcaliphila]|uniref:Broad-specificity linear acyl-CoA dehydrogenase FadE5 n=1 Tax=Dietzia psychralcaliphila TaxID=139021 RepID=A0AAD0JU76_9ACTN|nr:acyl-CoA dehydrogenase [Dietzia psychralcaliphila]AWH96737.1 butyryl-CoA dehydrogenase [Dietzia psychralcaliphila]PTM89374.1 alkylation response protein AidB-like acyl-CoA dehydrogenase [Dietzia psychralcaliphila]
MSHYRSNPRDLEFVLFEVFGLDEILERDDTELDGETVRTMLREAAALAEGPVAASFSVADRNPPTFDPETHEVTLPPEYVASVRAWQEAGWGLVGVDPAVGGVAAPRMVTWAITEFLLGANPSIFMYLSGPLFAEIMHTIGNEQQQKWAARVIDRNHGSSMMLTEAEVGSDVGAVRAKAIEQPDGTWHIEGAKRFITGADTGDLFENIWHQVLARPEGAGPGTKGLSYFLVPKYLPDPETAAPGERNGVYVTGIEKKMGLTASATCEVSFGAHDRPAVGYLAGDSHQGIKQMFKTIEAARMMVGTKAISTLSTGYLNALDFARDRVQGNDMADAGKPDAGKVTVIHHPDVRRSLLTQKAYAEGLRAVYLYAAAHQDVVAAEVVSGAGPELAHTVNDLLLPIVKGVGSERSYQCLAESLQCFGGSGYLRDYPLEQYIRDAKIDSLYEGTTAIQAQDFFFRKIIRDGGTALGHLAAQIHRTVDEAGPAELETVRTAVATALADVESMVGTLTGHLMSAQEDPESLYLIGLGAVPLLMAVGDLMVGWMLLREALVAAEKLPGATGGDHDFYTGKIVVAGHFARAHLPQVGAARATIEALELDVMRMPEGAF